MAEQQALKQGSVAEHILIERFFPVPAERVWEAFSDAEQLRKWWGPEGFSMPVCELDFRIGGRYLFCMRSAEGKDFWTTGSYREILPLKRIVFTDSFSDEQGHVVPASYYGMSPDFPLELLVTWSFEAGKDGTKLRLEHAGVPDKDKAMCAEGWNSFLDKLAAMLHAGILR